MVAVILRLVSYNLHEYVGTDGDRSPRRILEVLDGLGADLLLLQEVRNTHRADQQFPVIDWLADRLGMTAFLGTTLLRDDAPYGNACLSRYQPATWQRHDLSVTGREPRGLLEMQFGAELGGLRVLTTHLGLRPRERRQQYQRIGELLNNRPAPSTVLGGDFNDRRLPRAFRRTVPGASTVGRPSFPSRWPVLSLDRIHVWPEARLRSFAVVQNEQARVASDHLPVVAEIDITPTSDE